MKKEEGRTYLRVEGNWKSYSWKEKDYVRMWQSWGDSRDFGTSHCSGKLKEARDHARRLQKSKRSYGDKDFKARVVEVTEILTVHEI